MRRAAKALLGLMAAFGLLIAFAPWIRAQVAPGSPFMPGGGSSGGGGGSSWCTEPAGNGFLARVASLTCVARSIVAGTGVLVTDGDGVNGNVVIDLDTATTPQGSSGTATPSVSCSVMEFYLETDRNHLWWCTSTNTWTDVGPFDATVYVTFTSGTATPAASCTAGKALYAETDRNALWSCTSTDTWTDLSVPLMANASGTLGATHGGTGLATATQGDIIYASAANTWSALAAGTSGKVLQTNGAGANPSWVTPSSFDPINTYDLYEDFATGAISAGAVGANGLVGATVATGTISSPATTVEHPGIARLLSHATNDNSGINLVVASSGQNTMSTVWDAHAWSIDMVILPGSNSTAITNTAWWVGLAPSSAGVVEGTGANGIWVRHDSDLSDTTYVFAICNSATNGCGSAGDDTNQKTVASTITPVAGTWNRIRIRQSLTEGPGSTRLIGMRVNDETEKTFCSSGCDDTLATVPSSTGMTVSFGYYTRTTTGVLSGDIDVMHVQITGLVRY